MHCQLQGGRQIKALSLEQGTLVHGGKKHGSKSFENAKIGILGKIVGQPANGEGLELMPFENAGFQPGVKFGVADIGKDADDRKKRV
jgi:hypothetical protein